MKPGQFARIAAAVICILILCILAVAAYHRHMYPFGRRPGGISLPGVYGALVSYAGDHHGWFPRSEAGSYDALQELYGLYCPTGKELAGVSGNLDAVTLALLEGEPLDASLTSWVYVQGFRLDDPEDAAIIWESKPGLYYDGKRNGFGGRAVLLIGGDITNVPAVDWESFHNHQEQLRKTIEASRGVN
jgi:hypothetical protein